MSSIIAAFTSTPETYTRRTTKEGVMIFERYVLCAVSLNGCAVSLNLEFIKFPSIDQMNLAVACLMHGCNAIVIDLLNYFVYKKSHHAIPYHKMLAMFREIHFINGKAYDN